MPWLQWSFKDVSMTQFNVASFLSERARSDPSAPAVRFRKQRSPLQKIDSIFSFASSERNPEYDCISFRELDQSVDSLVHYFSEKGVKDQYLSWSPDYLIQIDLPAENRGGS